jgi:hypothetical protein
MDIFGVVLFEASGVAQLSGFFEARCSFGPGATPGFSRVREVFLRSTNYLKSDTAFNSNTN